MDELSAYATQLKQMESEGYKPMVVIFCKPENVGQICSVPSRYFLNNLKEAAQTQNVDMTMDTVTNAVTNFVINVAETIATSPPGGTYTVARKLEKHPFMKDN